MTSHPNFDRAQAMLYASRHGDYALAFDDFANDIVMENGPGAGPWHRARGKDDLALMLLELAGSFGDTFHQDGRCAHADDRVSISLIRETGTAPSGDRFDNLAVYIGRLRPDGTTERLSTGDLDAEHCAAFWQKNPATPSKDFAQQLQPGTRQSPSHAEPGHLPE
jgi:ketosteroid isomerase-like protein